ncbi:hypothetical protein BU25DRAFT_411667 [Macroventuria anomochaeta]|uniref:Uncharacterized protein n=1 Tax=Macroventuria anomochaeta TaxID=301207 RepID=A0ACB6RY93_9PLEO|nr:uncharacterized protein BU25DRAFT_411667 [Macroventuria anomochaeta]KAF2626698.1 hypothetical protein BU25DRAFT_411667 [Macroventuria anomochaeta]
MDHWGDPWADNANDKSPTKNAVTSPLPPAFTFAPVPLNGFVDDAGWGNNDDDGFGDCATSDAGNVASTGAVPTPAGGQVPDSADWATVTYEETEDDRKKWPEPASRTSQDLANVDSEPSDSSTVSQLDEAVNVDTAEEPAPQLQPEAESSVRSSTSPSETSRNELPIESPRTSIEDERAIKKEDVPHNEAFTVPAESDAIVADASLEVQTEEGVTDSKDASDVETVDELVADIGDTEEPSSRSSDDPSESGVGGQLDSASEAATTAGAVRPHAQSATFVTDEALLAQLFPLEQESGKQLDAHDDPIYSTSARKAWYRLTRKQTMREFNHGDNDDNYVRVTWTNSHVRAEVNKVVGRWAREDRISGTGPGARASFYWDTPAPAEPRAPSSHLRTQSSVPATKTALPARQSLPPLATDKPAAFDRGSPASAGPWKLENPAQRSTSTPLALKNPAVTMIQRQKGRAVSVDLTPRRPEQTTHKRTATVSHTAPKTKAVANLISPPISQSSAEVSDPWANFNDFDSHSTSTVQAADDTPVDDDDDWGEMVQTPTLPTPQQLDPFSQSSTTNHTLSTPPPPKPSPPGNIPAQAEPVEPMFASPIARLQSTISPTSALFKANSFVPLHAEHGPIGPGILKPSNRSVRPTPDKKLKIDVPIPSSAEKVDVAAVAISDNEGGSNDEFPTRKALQPVSLPLKSEEAGHAVPTVSNLTPTAQPATPIQPSADSWADADFSFFESALTVTASQPSSQTQDPSDPFSFFNTPVPTSTPPTSKLFPGSPPRDTTPPPLPPLTNATSSLQRRKAEEDQMISDILSGLPDLSYILR